MANSFRRKVSRNDLLIETKNIAYLVVGCIVLAFADAVFLTECNIVSGGVSSVGIIVNYYVEKMTGFNCVSLVVAGMQVLMWLIGLFTLGKRFSLNTLIASILYPVFFAVFYDLHIGNYLGLAALYVGANGQPADYGMLILAGIFGGALSGIGVAICYLGNGSTGGFDVISFIIAKYSDMKQDVSGFIIDSSLIILGIFCMGDSLRSLVGILAALACALAVQFVYINADSFVIVDIISSHYRTIQDYIHKDLGHATTLIDTTGGYSGEKHKMIRVVIYEVETTELKTKIAQIDPSAFVSFTQAKTINGRGFEPFVVRKTAYRRSLHRLTHETQYYEDEEIAKAEAERRLNEIKKATLKTASSSHSNAASLHQKKGNK